MRKIYFVRFSWDGGRSFRVYRVWFFQNIITKINESMSHIGKSGKRNIFIESIEVV